jgi:glycosyltransferase involved in cell wall biosynthesis
MNPFFSIVIPTYNSAKNLRSCIKSIFDQTFGDYEIIIVDGMSEDETCSIAKNYADNRINIISEKDNGVYDAMNKGIARSTGQWLYFLGSDDQLFDNKVLKDVKEVIGRAKSKLIYGNVKILGNTAWASDGTIYDGSFYIEKLLKKNICHQSIFYKASFIRDEIGVFNVRYRVCADWDLNMRCWQKTKSKYFRRTMALFNAGGISTFSADDQNFKKDFDENKLKYFGEKIEKISRPTFLDRLKLFRSGKNNF